MPMPEYLWKCLQKWSKVRFLTFRQTSVERAYRLYRERGDRPSAARMAIWLTSDYFDFRGEPAIADGWFQRARRLLEGLDPTPEHAWLTFMEGLHCTPLPT